VQIDLSSSSGHRGAGHGQGLLSNGGSGGTGDEEAGKGLESDEENVGNRKRRSLAADFEQSRPDSKSTAPAGFLRFGSGYSRAAAASAQGQDSGGAAG
jgi:hypothetical protein